MHRYLHLIYSISISIRINNNNSNNSSSRSISITSEFTSVNSITDTATIDVITNRLKWCLIRVALYPGEPLK